MRVKKYKKRRELKEKGTFYGLHPLCTPESFSPPAPLEKGRWCTTPLAPPVPAPLFWRKPPNIHIYI